MKKLFSRNTGLALLLLALGLTGCGGGGGSSSPNDTTQVPPTQDEDPNDNNDTVNEEDSGGSPDAPEEDPIVKSLTVYDEHLVSVDSFVGSINGPFVGLSESGEALAVWVTSDIDVLGSGEWNSTLHSMTGDIATKSWAEEQMLPLPKVVAAQMDMGSNGDAVIALSDDESVTVFHYTVAGGLGAPMQLKSVDNAAVVALDVNDRGDAMLVWQEFDTEETVSRLYDKDSQSWGGEVVMNVAANGDTYSTQGHVNISLNNAGQALFVDSVVRSGQSGEAVIARFYDGTNWSNLRGDETSVFPYADADSVSAFLDDQGRIVVGMGRRAPGEVYISSGTITQGLSEASLAFYNYSNQGLFQLDARWIGENQITATFVGRDLGSKHYASFSEDSGATWKVAGFFNGTYGNDSAKSSNSNDTIYIQDGKQCDSGDGFTAPLTVLNPDLTVKQACVITRMTSVDIAVNDAGQGVVMGESDAADFLVFHFFESNY